MRTARQQLQVVGAPQPIIIDLKTSRTQIATTIISALTLLGLAVGLGLTYIANRQTADSNREGQVTERFTNAVEQLGSGALDVRLGAIYALERIMRDSAADQPSIIEILTAYIRTHALSPDVDGAPKSKPDSVSLESPPPDVSAAVSVLMRRDVTYDRKGSYLNLHKTGLQGVSLSAADLSRANLSGANLYGANLGAANLYDANLYDVNLRGADLSRANLSAANLYDSDLRMTMGLTTDRLRCARVNDHTMLPDGIARPMAGAPTRDPSCSR